MNRSTLALRFLAIDHAADLPDLPFSSRLHFDPTHLLHGQAELLKEVYGSVEYSVYVPTGGGICEQSPVTVEQPPSLHHIGVIMRVECGEAPGIHFQNGGLICGSLALVLLQVGDVESVESWVFVTFSREVVEPFGDEETVSNADGMCTCKK